MNIHLHILNASGKLTAYLRAIESIFNKTTRGVTALLPIDNVDVVVYNNPPSVIPELGLGGYTPNLHLVFISLDIESPQFQKVIDQYFEKTLVHEFHHAQRWKNPGFGTTLFEAMVTEGLADHFVKEVTNLDPLPWTMALKSEEISQMKALAEKEFNNDKYSHDDWFFGSSSREIPRWSGYSLGYKIVGDYLQTHPGTKASMLYSTMASEFVS